MLLLVLVIGAVKAQEFCGVPNFYAVAATCDYTTNPTSEPCQTVSAAVTTCLDWPFQFPPPHCAPSQLETIAKGQIDVRCLHPLTTEGCVGGWFAPIQSKTDVQMALPCPQGFWCPNNWLCMIPCSEGAYCPSPSKMEDETYSDGDNHCVPGLPCCEPYGMPPLRGFCGGADGDHRCAAGTYCPTPAEEITCPEGHFCREGYTEPAACPKLSKCDPGTAAPIQNILGLIFDAGVITVAVFAVIAIRLRRKIKGCLADRKKESGRDLPLLDQSISRKAYTVEISFDGLGLELKGTSKRVLNGVTGSVRPGRVVAIMGPSGAGKTTFLSTLCGKAYYGNVTGQVLINGANDPVQKYKKITGFVPQEDVMHRVLTVREVLTFQARLRLPAATPGREITKKVDATLKLLKLEHIQDQIIGDEESRGISGGQRKRVNIGMELVCDPTLLFLDEPTSGLDSTSSYDVLEALQTVARQGGLTIVTVLHQPRFEIFQMFDDVLLLAPGGRTVYIGETNGALPHFQQMGYRLEEHVNPADFFMDVISGSKPNHANPDFTTDHLVESWSGRSGSINNRGSRGDPNYSAYEPRKTPSKFKQALVFLHRGLLLQTRIMSTLALDLFLSLFAGGVLGLMFMDVELSKLGPLNSMNALVIGLCAMLRAMRTFSNERIVYWREAATGASPLAYFFGFNLSQVPMMLITPFVYLSLLYTLTSPHALFVSHYQMTLATEFACVGLGNLIAAAFNPRNCQMAIVVLGLVSAMVSGNSPTIATLNDILIIGPVSTTLSYARWVQEGLFEAEVRGYSPVWNAEIQGMIEHFGFEIEIDQTTGEVTSARFALCCGILIVFGIVSRVMAYLLMVFTHRGQQQ